MSGRRVAPSATPNAPDRYALADDDQRHHTRHVLALDRTAQAGVEGCTHYQFTP